MKHLGLFEGIGGFSLAARWVGWETVAWCEWDKFCQRVLKYHFPEAEGYGNIKETDFKKYANKIDILTGGFPCQPYSTAGKRLGKEDERYLWPEMLRAIREVQPTWVVGENVRGLTNWNGGLVFDEVQADLEAQGYEVLPFLLPAAGVNAPHRRDRIWFIAHSNGAEQKNRQRTDREQTEEIRRQETGNVSGEFSGPGIITLSDGSPAKYEIETGRDLLTSDDKTFTYTNGFGLWREGDGVGKSRFFGENYTGNYWENFPTQSPICNGNDGISSRLDFDAVFEGIRKPRRANAYGRWRVESIKAGGNAIVPQVAYEIFKAIQQYEEIKNTL